MNRYEAIVFDAVLDLHNLNSYEQGQDREMAEKREYAINVLLSIVQAFRAPIEETRIEDGCGALVDAKGEVVA